MSRYKIRTDSTSYAYGSFFRKGHYMCGTKIIGAPLPEGYLYKTDTYRITEVFDRDENFEVKVHGWDSVAISTEDHLPNFNETCVKMMAACITDRALDMLGKKEVEDIAKLSIKLTRALFDELENEKGR